MRKEGTIRAYKVSTGLDTITPGTSTVGYVQDYDCFEFARFDTSQTQRRVNAFICLDPLPTHCPLYDKSAVCASLFSARRWLSLLLIF